MKTSAETIACWCADNAAWPYTGLEWDADGQYEHPTLIVWFVDGFQVTWRHRAATTTVYVSNLPEAHFDPPPSGGFLHSVAGWSMCEGRPRVTWKRVFPGYVGRSRVEHAVRRLLDARSARYRGVTP